MDLRPPRHYVAGAMELLLILSAMLSAVTGAVGGARAPEARLHAAVAAEARAIPSATVAAPSTARVAVYHAIDRQAPIALPAPRLAAPIPLYADRLIE